MTRLALAVVAVLGPMRWTVVVALVMVGCDSGDRAPPSSSNVTSAGPTAEVVRDANVATAGPPVDARVEPEGELTAEIAHRLDSMPRPIMITSDDVESVGFYGDGAGPRAKRGSRVTLAVRIWKATGPPPSPPMDAPESVVPLLEKTVVVTVGKAQYGALIDAVLVPPSNTDPPNPTGWAVRKGAIRRIDTHSRKFTGITKDVTLPELILVELKVLAIR